MVLPPGHALVTAQPPSLELTIRTDGWSLVSMIVARPAVAVVRPRTRGGVERTYILDRDDLLRSIQTTVSSGQLVSISPDTLVITLGPTRSRRVPLLAAAEIVTKPGFQVIGPLRVIPDSIDLIGSARVLPTINEWRTERTRLSDVHQPINARVAISDSLPGVVFPSMRSARLVADVQEIAERSFPDVPVMNRSTMRDTNLRLVLQPPRITVMVRGGARDLSRLSPTEVRAYVDIVEGADTFGVAQPRVITPVGSHFSVVAVTPKLLKYLWRRQ